MHGGWHAWPGGTCVAGGGVVWHVYQGACVAGWACGRGCAWQGACVAGETTTAADGTHPTEMYSCFC